MEEQYVVDRSKLRTLLNGQSHLSIRELQNETGRSEAFVLKWKKRMAGSNPEDVLVLRSRSRRRTTPPATLDQRVEKAILAIRDNPPAQLGRVPGPKTIHYYLNKDEELKKLGLKVPGETTIWKVLCRHQRILRQTNTEHEELDRPAPMVEWEIDFADVDTATPEPDGKRQHMVEVFNIVDRGTSILIDSLPAKNYNEETALLTLLDVFTRKGLPQVIRLDRDPRFVGSWTIDGFPSAFVRFLLCLGLRVELCPPRRPDLKPIVERFNKTLKYELILVKRPATVEETSIVLEPYKTFFNEDRPHQGTACHNQPPLQAFPDLPVLPHLPAKIDGDTWLTALHNKYFKRRVTSKGTVSVDNDSYYIGKRFAGQYVLLQIDAKNLVFHVEILGKAVKDIPIKSLLGEPLPFDEYVDLITKQARSEVRHLRMAAQLRRALSTRSA